MRLVDAFWWACIVAICAVSMCACSAVESVEPSSDMSACEQLSPSHECGVVYQCTRGTELCIREQDLAAAELANGPCDPSTDGRFTQYTRGLIDPPCYWVCDGQRGCNAHNGCWGCP